MLLTDGCHAAPSTCAEPAAALASRSSADSCCLHSPVWWWARYASSPLRNALLGQLQIQARWKNLVVSRGPGAPTAVCGRGVEAARKWFFHGLLGLFMTLVRFHRRDVVQTARQAAVAANQNAVAPAA